MRLWPSNKLLGENVRKLIFTLLVVSVAGCSLLNVSKREISLAEKKWHSSGIKNYNYNLTIATLALDQACSTPRVGIEIEVRDGHLKKFGTCDLNAKHTKGFGTIEAVFLTLRNEKSESPPGLEVRFNEIYGFPEYIDINYSRWFTDHRIQYHISEFSVVE